MEAGIAGRMAEKMPGTMKDATKAASQAVCPFAAACRAWGAY